MCVLSDPVVICGASSDAASSLRAFEQEHCTETPSFKRIAFNYFCSQQEQFSTENLITS